MADTKTKRFSDRTTQHEMLHVEGARQPAQPAKRGLSTGSLAIERQDTHNPYTRIPEAEHRRAQGQRTDLRKLSAWIKMMRALEEARKRDED